MNKITAITLFLIFTLLSCKKSTQEIEYTFLSNSIEQINIANNYEWIVVLPGAGCHGCIQEGEYFMKENIDNRKILFVLINTSSLKLLQQKIGVKLKEHSNVYIDKDFIFDIPSNNVIYPCVIRLEKGKIKQFEFQSPKNAAFHKIKKFI